LRKEKGGEKTRGEKKKKKKEQGVQQGGWLDPSKKP